MNDTKIKQLQNTIDEANMLLKSLDKLEQLNFIIKTIDIWNDNEIDISNGMMAYLDYYEECLFNLNMGVWSDNEDDIPQNLMAFSNYNDENLLNLNIVIANDYDWLEDLKQLINNLLTLKKEIEKPTINNVNTNQNTITISLSTTISKLKKTLLSKDELLEIIELLNDANEQKSDAKEIVWVKVKKVLAWLGDKTVDVGIAVLPFILSII